MAFFRTCDGIGRRDVLKAGVVGGTGLTLASFAQLTSASHVNPNAKAKAAIFVNLNGGPSVEEGCRSEADWKEPCQRDDKAGS